MGLFKKKSKEVKNTTPAAPEPPKLVNRRENRQSTFKMGRTIGEKREKLETKNEREAARKKDKKRQDRRVVFVCLGFAALIAILAALAFICFGNGEPDTPAETPDPDEVVTITNEPTIEIIDEDDPSGSHISSRMRSYIGQAEADFRDLGYTPVKAVLPAGAIREIDFYLDGHPGYVKLTLDRDSAVSVEDADRMYRYLAEAGIAEFTYIDVRLSGKAYWK